MSRKGKGVVAGIIQGGTQAGVAGAAFGALGAVTGGGKAEAGGKRKRAKRIVISEHQWEFIRTLINAITHRGSMPHFKKRRHHKKPFF